MPDRFPEPDLDPRWSDEGECECGHVEDEHDEDGCTVADCPCLHFDAAPVPGAEEGQRDGD